ncbi:MAG TPA: hypothetical protein PLB53_04930 [Candidatus Atribacteria bacterium]|nr:hypothetical protein [Candidatus Atribacteria bacterium]HQD32742.1 hypothetical protein [Candidatus Atribacteria bacterium]
MIVGKICSSFAISGTESNVSVSLGGEEKVFGCNSSSLSVFKEGRNAT